MPLKQGDKAPDFSLLDQDGKTVKLVDLKGAGRSSCTSTHNG
jgi:peroxiredoxin